MTTFRDFTSKVWQLFLRNSLWVAAIGIMLSSSGLDGTYLAKMMPFSALGYILNTTADVATLLIAHYFGRLQQERSKTKKKMSWWLLGADLVSAGFSWFFSWRQCLTMLPSIEGADARWIAPISAAFAPTLLIFIGYAQAIVAGKFEKVEEGKVDSKKPSKKELKEEEGHRREEFAIGHTARRRVSDKIARRVMARDGSACYYCGVDMKDWDAGDIHIDHFWPVASGGSDDEFNLVVSCAKCNWSKNSREPIQSEIDKLKVHLVNQQDCSSKEKVWVLKDLGLLGKQKDVAIILSISPGYVSSSLRECPDLLPASLVDLCEHLNSVGKAQVSLTKPEAQTVNGDNGHQVLEMERLSVQ